MKRAFVAIVAGILLVPALVAGSLAFVVPADSAHAAPDGVNLTKVNSGGNEARGTGQVSNLEGNGGVIQTGINILLYIIGVISVIMIIIGGLRYATSGGNASTVTSAKNTILYAVIGLVIAIFAYAIINFVLNNVASKS
mgnify:CR=1 FL=1